MLAKIINMENGGKDNKEVAPKTDAQENTFIMGETLKMMKAKTGRTSFTLVEMLDPAGTIKKYTTNPDK